ncbi:double-strand break repair protein AddB [Maritalea porphyrae]|uniref:Double-strand break repair protein AddB n=1 Tax=Maritalea porphyrae TaxID=880732 RepID=A0ABQ5UT65_9HYPH|nr:double-strand break repair protein AddB [Maritalea porphyrae]GLQ17152.1 double-strand break repair protein AddB [Maritalea porphyrae]
MHHQKLFSIAPDAPFLPTLARSLMDGTLLPDWSREGAFWLSDITIYVPTKRARLALIDQLLALNGGTQLLPNIFTLGEGDDAENAFFTDPDVDSFDVTSKLYRTTILGQLIKKWAEITGQNQQPGFSSPPSTTEILAMAQSLGSLIDDFLTEEVGFERIKDLVPEELAQNWQETLKFLDIAFSAWPDHLREIGQIDAALLRRQRFDFASKSLSLRYGNRPVIAAGSTGSVPATRRFLKSISDLPNAAIVLPGFDVSMSPNEHAHLIEDKNQCHAHPQFGMAKLLREIGEGPQAVQSLGHANGARASILNATLARIEQTAYWHDQRAQIETKALSDALENVSIMALDNLDHEARAIALAAREAVETGQNVGIISPDRDLARRIKVELERFDIVIDDSAGMPLSQSPAGRWFRQLLAALQSNFKPVDLVAFLANRSVRLGRERAEISKLRELLDLSTLRGARGINGLVGIKKLIADNASGETKRVSKRLTQEEALDLIALIDDLQTAVEPICTDGETVWNMARIARAIPNLIAKICGQDAAQSGMLQGVDELLKWAEDLARCTHFSPNARPDDVIASINLLMQNISVRPPETTRQDVQIWGRIEARLLHADLMILAGLNEGVWPEIAEPGPWLSRGMKLAIKLDPPERKIGLAAHDFLMAMGAPKVLISYAKRRGTSPSDPSRFIQRLEAFLGEKRSKALYRKSAHFKTLITQIDAAETVRLSPRPAPTPPANIRPRRLSITEIETLVRDPYAIYIRHVLGLRKLRALGAAPDTAERGNLIHEVLATFVQKELDFSAPDAHQQLMDIALGVYAKLDDVADRRDIWLKRFSAIAHTVIAFERNRHVNIIQRNAEIRGSMTLPVANENVTIYGDADRIDILKSGAAELIDFKTGSIPTNKDMQNFMSPQLPMEAMILRHAGFGGVPQADSDALTYIKLSHGPNPFEVTNFATGKQSLDAVIDDYWQHFSAYAQIMLMQDHIAMAAQLMPKENQQFAGDYDHFARQKEWMIDQGDDE